MSGVLASLKVLDFSTLLPGPYASMLLADMGADVLRVESPTRPDLVQFLPPRVDDVSAVHAFLNRGKRSIAIDLKTGEGVDLIKKLVQDYDIVLEQFRPGVMARLGLDYETLKAINPGLIYCSITGYGQTGPYRDRAGHDINYLALAGVADYSRRCGQAPVPQAIQIADVAGGSHHAVMGILAAVIHRQQSGEGQQIDISMTDCAFALNAMSGASALAGGELPAPENQMLNGGSFYDYYATSDGRYLAVGSLEPQFLKGLCEAVGHPEWLALGGSQATSDKEIFKQKLADVFASESLAYWEAQFAARDVCVEPVLSFAEAQHHEQLKSRDMVIEVPTASGKSIRQLGHPIKFSAAPCQSSLAGGRTGMHTDEVLGELGYEPDHIERLRREKVIK